MNKGLVSIITPAYNAGVHISETIESVLNQTYKNWEMIIINDCSKDNTLEIINEFARKDNRIKIINLESNGGAANAWNHGFKVMQGEFLAFIDSDDLWIPEKLEIQINFMKANNYEFTFGEYEWIAENSKSLNKIIKAPKSINYQRMIKKNDIGLLTVMIDRKSIHIEPIPTVSMAWDYLLWIRIMEKNFNAYGFPKVLGYYRILPNSASRNKSKAAKGIWEIYKNQLHFPLFKRIFYFTQYSLISLKRHYIE